MVDNKLYQWQWYSRSIGWKNYDDKLSNKIDEAYSSGCKKYAFKIRSNDTKYQLDFNNMTQHNLSTNKLRTIRRKNIEITSKYIPFAFDEDSNLYKLCCGYMRDMEKEYKLSSIIASTVIMLIHSYQQYYIVCGNEFCTVDPMKRILSTPGNANKCDTFVILSQPLNCGIYEFTVNCLNSAKKATWIGIVSELNLRFENEKWLFKSNETMSGDSYQLYLRKRQRIIQHVSLGAILEREKINHTKSGEMVKGDVCSLMIDFITSRVIFFINSKQMGKAMKLANNVAYYATFAYSVNNQWFHKTGPCEFQYSLTEPIQFL